MSDRLASILNFLRRPRKLALVVILILLVLQLTIFIPPVKHTNPPGTQTISWDSPRTEELMRQSCMDCHSNETVWPWYSFIAPVSWLVGKDVHEGRDNLNFSTGHESEIEEIIESIHEGEMPPLVYTITHRDAKLTDAEKRELIAGITATFGTSGQTTTTPSESGENQDGSDNDSDD